MHVVALVEATPEGQAKIAEWLHRQKYPEGDGKYTSPAVTEIKILDIKIRKECVPYLLSDIGYFETKSRKAIAFRNGISKAMGLLKKIFGIPIEQPQFGEVNKQAAQNLYRVAKMPVLAKFNTIGIMDDDYVDGEEGV